MLVTLSSMGGLGRIAARFDRGGMRQERAQAAQRRHDQIQATQNRVEAAQNSRGTPPAPPANTINNVAPRPTPTGQATTVEGQDAGTGVPPRPPTLAVPNANNHQDRASAGRKRMVEDSSEEDEGFSAEEEELLQEDCDEPDEPEFFLKTVHDVRLSGRRLEYLVEWEDWPNVEDFTWEPTAHLPGHKDLLHEFKSKWISEGKPWPRT